MHYWGSYIVQRDVNLQLTPSSDYNKSTSCGNRTREKGAPAVDRFCRVLYRESIRIRPESSWDQNFISRVSRLPNKRLNCTSSGVGFGHAQAVWYTLSETFAQPLIRYHNSDLVSQTTSRHHLWKSLKVSDPSISTTAFERMAVSCPMMIARLLHGSRW